MRINKVDLANIINDYSTHSLADLAFKYGRSIEGIRKALARNGIQIRSTGEERLRKNNKIRITDFEKTQYLGVYIKDLKYFVILRNKIIAEFPVLRDAAIFYNEYVLKNGIRTHLNNIT